jgi:hypothetical protein
MSAELFSAVASGNADRVRELLASNPGVVNMNDDEGAKSGFSRERSLQESKI